MVGALYGCRKILEASLVTPADIALRDIMATGENSISDSSQVDLNIFCPDVDQHDFEATNSRVNHHLQVALAGKSGFDREALAFLDVLAGGVENLASRRYSRCSGSSWLQRLADRVGVKQGNAVYET